VLTSSGEPARYTLISNFLFLFNFEIRCIVYIYIYIYCYLCKNSHNYKLLINCSSYFFNGYCDDRELRKKTEMVFPFDCYCKTLVMTSVHGITAPSPTILVRRRWFLVFRCVGLVSFSQNKWFDFNQLSS
jgi:hypothetical protein